MKTTLLKLTFAALAAASACSASAAVVTTFGAGSLINAVTNAANFDGNLNMVSGYVEGGLVFNFSGAGNNNNCGYAGLDCYDDSSELGDGFTGNYMSTAGNNAYVSVRMADGSDFKRLEFSAGSGYATVNGYWRTLRDGLQTGAGNFSAANGVVVGLMDVLGFDEVRYFAFSTPNKSSGFSSAAIDSVRVGVPEPASLALFGLGLLGLGGMLRRR